MRWRPFFSFFFFFGIHLILGAKTLQFPVKIFFFLVCTRFRERKDKISTTVLSDSECVWSRLQKRPPCKILHKGLKFYIKDWNPFSMASFIHREFHNYWEPNRKQLQVFKVYVFIFWVAAMFLFFVLYFVAGERIKKVCRKRRKEDNRSFLQPLNARFGFNQQFVSSLVALNCYTVRIFANR